MAEHDTTTGKRRHDGEPLDRPPPLVEAGGNETTATEQTWQALTTPARSSGRAVVVVALALIALGGAAVGRCWIDGTAALGDNLPVGRGCQAVNTTFWTGLGAGALLLSSLLMLSRQRWRGAIGRAFDTVALAALLCATWHGVVALGRPAALVELLPGFNPSGLSPNLLSPTLWNAALHIALPAVALLWWGWGQIPDLPLWRERTGNSRRAQLQRAIARGGLGTAARWPGWRRWQPAVALLVAGCAVAAVLTSSLPQIFSALPGWHDPLWPIHALASALASATAVTALTVVVARRTLQLEPLITPLHLDRLSRLLLALTLLVGYCRSVAFFTAWYSGNFDQAVAFDGQAFGDYGWAYWTALACGIGLPQAFWWRAPRRQPIWIAVAASLVAGGLWLDRWVLLIAPQQHGLVGASWGGYRPSAWDIALTSGGIGLFVLLVALLLWGVPPIAIGDLRHDLAEAAARASFADEEPTT